MNSKKQTGEVINIICSNEIMAGTLAENRAAIAGRMRLLNCYDPIVLKSAVSDSFIVLQARLIVKAWKARN